MIYDRSSMELIKIRGNEDFVKSVIARRGYAAEHNFDCYMHYIDPETEALFFKYSADEGILLSYWKEKEVYFTFSGVLADEKKRLGCFMSLLDHVFDRGAKKVSVEFEENFRKLVVDEVRNNKKYNEKYKDCKVFGELVWPVFDMKTWNGDLMQGKDWKDIRYWWNKFFREHKVEFKPASEVSKRDMKKLVKEWKSQRTTGDRTYAQYYLQVIDDDFRGFDITRIMIVDGKVAAITAGFAIPNKSYYYSSVGLYTRSISNVGEVCNMDDLINLKKLGYETVDFGGGADSLTNFKKKFRPSYFYKTVYFSIKRKGDNKRW